MQVNMNESARVRLTAKGVKVYSDYYRNLDNEYRINFYEYAMSKIKDGYFQTMLWEIMHIFGHAHYIGNDTCFEGNCIEILENG